MKKLKSLALILLIGSITGTTFYSCKKYADGPMFSVKPAKMRIVGTWDLKEVNGISGGNNSSQSYTMYTTCGTTVTYTQQVTGTESWEFTSSGSLTMKSTSTEHTVDYNATYLQCSAIYKDTTLNDNATATWAWGAQKKSILVTVMGVGISMTIDRLTSKDLWLSYTGIGSSGSETYKYKFAKK